MQIPWDAVEAVGTWFAGIVTAGTLAVAIFILLRDRNKELSAQARRIAVFSDFDYDYEDDPHSYASRLTIKVWNHSDRPIFGLHIYGFSNLVMHYLEISGTDSLVRHGDMTLLPGEQATRVFDQVDGDLEAALSVIFRDADNQSWQYQLGPGELRPMDLQKGPK